MEWNAEEWPHLRRKPGQLTQVRWNPALLAGARGNGPPVGFRVKLLRPHIEQEAPRFMGLWRVVDSGGEGWWVFESEMTSLLPPVVLTFNSEGA